MIVKSEWPFNKGWNRMGKAALVNGYQRREGKTLKVHVVRVPGLLGKVLMAFFGLFSRPTEDNNK